MRYSENFQGLFSCQTQELAREELEFLKWISKSSSEILASTSNPKEK